MPSINFIRTSLMNESLVRDEVTVAPTAISDFIKINVCRLIERQFLQECGEKRTEAMNVLRFMYEFAPRIAMILTENQVERIRFPSIKRKVIRIRTMMKKHLKNFMIERVNPKAYRLPQDIKRINQITSREEMIEYLNTGGRLFAVDNWDYLTDVTDENSDGKYGPNPFKNMRAIDD